MSEKTGRSMPPRWLGLAPFTEEDRPRFFGRDREIQELVRRVSNRRTTVLFGQSGLGKTSLLRAGLFPELRRLQFTPVYIRIDYHDAVPDPLTQVRAHLEQALGIVLPPDQSLTGWAHCLKRGLAGTSLRGVTPAIVLDQFEELFTVAVLSGEGKEGSERFLNELADLFEARPDESLARAFDTGEKDVADYDFETSSYRIVLSIREDYLPQLERFRGAMPSLMENRLPLDRMRGDQALEAIMGPGEDIVEQDVAEAVVQFVGGGNDDALSSIEVEPSLLSLICRRLDESRGEGPITRELLVGRREEIIGVFYLSCFEGLMPEVRVGVEELLITEAGYRENVASETLEASIGEDALKGLVKKRLLQIDARNGRTRVELAHDLLCRVAVESRKARRLREARSEKEQKAHATRRRRLRTSLLVTLGVLCPLIAALAWVAFTGWEEALALKSKLEVQNHTLRGSSSRLTNLLLGDGNRSKSPLSTGTLVSLIPEMETLQYSIYDASEEDAAAGRSLALFHFQAAVAYKNGGKPELATNHLEEGKTFLSLLESKERVLIKADYLLEEAAVNVLLGPHVKDLSPEEYAKMCAPLERAMERLKPLMDAKEAATLIPAAWRWLDVSNDLATNDRLRADLDRARARYHANIKICDGESLKDNPSIRRMKAIALNGLGIIAEEYFIAIDKAKKSESGQSDESWMEGVTLDERPYLEEMLEFYEKARQVRHDLWKTEESLANKEKRRADPWIAHEFAYALANLAGAHYDCWITAGQKRADWDKAYTMMQRRRDLHQLLNRQDPGNKAFQIACAHGIANLAHFQAMTIEPLSKQDISRWRLDLKIACQMAPEESQLQRMLDEVEKLPDLK